MPWLAKRRFAAIATGSRRPWLTSRRIKRSSMSWIRPAKPGSVWQVDSDLIPRRPVHLIVVVLIVGDGLYARRERRRSGVDAFMVPPAAVGRRQPDSGEKNEMEQIQHTAASVMAERTVSFGTWNMDHWRRTAQQRRDGWSFLRIGAQADVMLLQESVIPSETPRQLDTRDDDRTWPDFPASRSAWLRSGSERHQRRVERWRGGSRAIVLGASSRP